MLIFVTEHFFVVLLFFCQGMVDPGENVSATLKREFGEESLGALDMPAEKRAEVEKKLDQLFKGGEEVCVLTVTFFSGEIVSLFHRDSLCDRVRTLK